MTSRAALVFAVSSAAACASVAPSSVGSPGGRLQDEDYRSEFVVSRAAYLTGRWHRMGSLSDFDGNTLLVGPDTTVIPDGGSGDGVELGVGYTRNGSAYELTYTKLAFDDVDYANVALNGLYFFSANEEIQPYLLFGLLFPWAELDDASTDGMVTGDAKLRAGFGFSFGGGVMWFFGNRVAFDLRGVYMWQEFSEAEGVLGISGSIDDAVDGSGFGVSAGLTIFHLLRPSS